MVRESKIKELISKKIIPVLENQLSIYGFRYRKSKNDFILKSPQGFSQTISFTTPYKPISYKESIDQLLLVFHINARIQIPGFTKWYFEQFSEIKNIHYDVGYKTCCIDLSIDDFGYDSFYEPSSSQKFKRLVSDIIDSETSILESITPLDEFLKIILSNWVSILSEQCDIVKSYEKGYNDFSNICLLMYGGQIELANKYFEKYHQELITTIENKLKISELEASGYISTLEYFIKRVQKVSTLNLLNPFVRTIRTKPSKNEILTFSDNVKFIENLRLDISQLSIKAICINPICETLLVTNDLKVIKLNKNGEIIFESEIEIKEGFKELSYIRCVGFIKNKNEFYVNNYLITSQNKVVELELPVKELKKGNLQESYITAFEYSVSEDKYFIVCDNQLLTYNKVRKLENVLEIDKNNRISTIFNKWIVTEKKENQSLILDFNGKELNNYAYSKGNRVCSISSDGKYMVHYGYSTKSQLYDLSSGKMSTIWAHPTYIKDYKEKMYDDIEHNFGMSIAEFSPDCKYLVGGAYHGKYVAWTLPNLKRIELLPQNEMIEMLLPSHTKWWTIHESGETITKPEKFTIDNQVFLKNRSINNLTKIIFLDNGDYFLTQINNYVLTWDRQFLNLNFKKLEGNIDIYADKYLTQKTSNELIIYEKA